LLDLHVAVSHVAVSFSDRKPSNSRAEALNLASLGHIGMMGAILVEKLHVARDIRLTGGPVWLNICPPMARFLTTETPLQGTAQSSFVASACPSRRWLGQEHQPGCRESANRGKPSVRW
jgi:hypothetical protein